MGRILGDGNFAVVRECVCRKTRGEYALKIIDKTKCRGKEHMIESEVSILRQVSGWSAVTIIIAIIVINKSLNCHGYSLLY